MLSAIDTNVISALWSYENVPINIAQLLAKYKSEGGLIVSGPVYAELLAYPNTSVEYLDKFLEATGIEVDYYLKKSVWEMAGKAYSDYAIRRRKARGGQTKRILADFVIGAHALVSTDRLITLDKNRYNTSFPELNLV